MTKMTLGKNLTPHSVVVICTTLPNAEALDLTSGGTVGSKMTICITSKCSAECKFAKWQSDFSLACAPVPATNGDNTFYLG